MNDCIFHFTDNCQIKLVKTLNIKSEIRENNHHNFFKSVFTIFTNDFHFLLSSVTSAIWSLISLIGRFISSSLLAILVRISESQLFHPLNWSLSFSTYVCLISLSFWSIKTNGQMVGFTEFRMSKARFDKI